MAGAGGVVGGELPESVATAASRIPHAPIVVALSGGPDSAVAGWLAQQYGPRGDVRAVFVDHRWIASEEMRQAATAIAAALRLPLQVVTVEPASSEGAARDARLTALEEAAGSAVIVTGHHRDDTAETVLGNLLRGAGAAGLSGIPGSRPPYLRPLNDVPADEVRAAALILGLPFADDPANRDPSHRRNRLRHEVLPLLEEIQPGVRSALARTARLLGGDDAVLEDVARRVPLRIEQDAVLVPFGALHAHPRPVAARVARRALRIARPPYPGSASDVDAILDLPATGSAQLGAGLLAVREGPFVAIYDPRAVSPPADPVAVTLPGEIELAGFTLSVRVLDRAGVPPIGRMTAWLDASLDDLVARPTATGERIDVGGGSKPVRDAMAEAGVPTRLRPGWPVLAARGKIAWVVRVRTAAWARADAATGTVLEARATRRDRVTR